MKLMTRDRFASAVCSWIGAIALLAMAPAAMAEPPYVEVGPDQTIEDTDRQDGELVTLRVDTYDPDDPEGAVFSIEWRLVTLHGAETTLGYGATLQQVPLNNGTSIIRVYVTDYNEETNWDEFLITVLPPGTSPPIVDAGPDRTVRAGETIQLTASGSDPDGGNITDYTWFRYIGDGEEFVDRGQTISTQLSEGVHYLRVEVTDDEGSRAEDSVTITAVAPPPAPTANAGGNRVVNDTDRRAREPVVLDGRGSTDPDDNITGYLWERLDGGNVENLGSGATLEVSLPDGENVIRLTVTDGSNNSDWDTAVITVNPPAANGQPTANAGVDRSVADTDRAAGEIVVLDGRASSDPEGSIASYTWSRVNGETTEELGSGATLERRLPDGENVIRLVVTDAAQNSASDTVVITVGAAVVAPTANAGADRNIADTDAQDGEDVVLDGSYSVDPDGTIVNYAWSRVTGDTTESLGSGGSPMLQTRLADGEHVIRLVVTDNTGDTASDTAIIRVNAVVITRLENIPGLSPNQKSMAQALDRICGQLRGTEGQLSADQQDLMSRCDGLQMNNTTANQVAALDEIVADDFAVARTQTLLFANTQYAGVMDRLMALRGGAKGLSLAGLNIIVDGQPVPLAQLQQMAKGLFGGGASADEPGGLLNDKWGMWARGNYSMGEKDRNTKSPGFDADQWAMVGGVDYRYSDELVGGVSLAYGQSTIDFEGGEGGLDTTSWAASLYGSSYVAKKFYLDAIINIANADYGADRNIAYIDGAGLVDVDASGDTSGMTYSAGISGGRDFLYRGFTVSPTLGLFYIDATIDKFSERGAGGLNLIYDEQTFQSFTGNLGFRVTYAWNLSWGVVMPHLRVDYVREFKDDVDVFGVRFAADPNAMSAPPILVETDNPDESYWRLATGFSTQLVDGISGYFEYQRLESFEFISFQDLSMGLRFQKSF